MTCHPSLCSPSSLASQRELRKRAGSLDPYGLNDAEDVQVPSPLLSFQLIKYTLHGRSSSSRNSSVFNPNVLYCSTLLSLLPRIKIEQVKKKRRGASLRNICRRSPPRIV